jgi:L-lactate dehydrogenase complex protein LldG
MSSRDKILKEIKANKPAETVLAGHFSFEKINGNLTEKYIQVLQGIGGVVKTVGNLDEVEVLLKQKIAAGELVVNGVDSLTHFNIEEYADKPAIEIEKVQTCFLKGTLAVAENASIWMPERNIVNRLLPFLCQQLVIVIEEKNIVGTMHEAYDRIKVDEDGYGAFIAGPSKTADIEQSLVIGAHGPVSLTVFVVKDR